MVLNGPKTRKVIYYGMHLIGIFLLVYVLQGLNFNDFLFELKSYNLQSITFCFLSLIIVYLLKSFRWFRIVKSLGGKVSFSQSVKYYILAVFFSILTPGRLGEFLKIYFLRKDNVLNNTDAWVSTIIDRLFDVIVLGIAGLISILYFTEYESLNVFGVIVLVVFLFFVFIFFIPELYRKVLFRLLPKRKYRVSMIIFSNSIIRTRPGSLMSLFLSVLSLLFLGSIPFIISFYGVYKIDLFTSIGAVSVSNILSFLPITIAGFGTRELVFSYFWELISYPKYVALSVSTVYFIIVYIGSILIGIVIYIAKFYKKFDLKKIKNERNYK